MDTNQKVLELKHKIDSFNSNDKEALIQFKTDMLGKKGQITELLGEIKNIAVENRKEFGNQINILKQIVLDKLNNLEQITNYDDLLKYENVDFTVPIRQNEIGSLHPLTIINNKIIDIFRKQGFTLSDGPEIEDDWHNFTALNFPEDHPARDMQDTFFLSNPENKLLRTHTSNVQIRSLENYKPPIKILSPGRVYRNEDISARSHCFFNQIEGLYVDEDVSFLEMKNTLLFFVRNLFGENVKIRLRPSFFPFTEPSAEMDISCTLCNGKGCNICKGTGWLEILGCGMVDPNVLENCKIDHKKYTGYAFGMGVERIANLKFGVKDIRKFSENDIRFLSNFKGVN